MAARGGATAGWSSSGVIAALVCGVFVAGVYLMRPLGKPAPATMAATPGGERWQTRDETPPADPLAQDDAGALQHPAPQRAGVHLAALWFGLFGAFVALSIQTLVNYAVANDSCFVGRIANGTSATAPWWILLSTTVFAIVLGSGAIGVAFWSWRRVKEESGMEEYDSKSDELLEIGEGRTRFMAMAGLVTSAILLATILFHGTAVLFSAFCRTVS